jgi:RNA polymerase-binding transcription factor DksA
MEGTLMSADLASISTLTTMRRSPASEGRHLHPAALPQWRALLERCWRERLERVTLLSLAFHEAAGTAADECIGRAARFAAGHQASRLLRRTVAERRALADIEAALARLAAGRFGWCEQCGLAIPAATLAEMPQASYCAACDP